MKKPNGYVIYDGPSALTGDPIIAIAVGLNTRSKNRKTGGMLQTYILVKDMDPRDANKCGADTAICGNCPHKGTPTTDPNRKLAQGRSCYVGIHEGVLQTYRTYLKGNYPDATNNPALLESIGTDRAVRIGTYGDGASVPLHVWRALLKSARKHTAYSHQAGWEGSEYDPNIFMRSVDTITEAREAWKQGQRTFRVVASVDDIDRKKEIQCPSPKVTCEQCALCAGASKRGKSIAIPVHGTGTGNFLRRQSA